MRGKRKGISPRGSRLVDGSKRKNIMVVHCVFIYEWSRVLSVLGESQWDHLVRNRERIGWLFKAEFAAKTNFEIVLEKFWS